MDSVSKEKWEKGEHRKTVTGNYKHHFQKRDRYVRGLLSKYSEGLWKAIEVGCGDGNNLALLQEFFVKVDGCDNNPVRVERARRSYPKIRVFCADATQLNSNTVSNNYDFVLLNHVLEHITEDSKVLEGIRDILKAGGFLLIGTPNEGVFLWQLAYKLQPKARRNTDHVNFYTRETLIKKCEDVGFTPVEFKYIGWGVPHWSIDSRLHKYKIIDDIFETIGRRLIPSQATSMYLLVKK